MQDEGFPSRLEIGAIALAFIPFICNLSTSTSRTVNGVVVEESSRHYVALVLGPLAILAALAIATMLPNTPDSLRLKRIGIIALVVVTGIFQVLRGFGTL